MSFKSGLKSILVGDLGRRPSLLVGCTRRASERNTGSTPTKPSVATDRAVRITPLKPWVSTRNSVTGAQFTADPPCSQVQDLAMRTGR
jgi:hypothetical protein